MTDPSSEAVVYYQITIAVHVDLATERVDRVVELREEVRSRVGDPPRLVTEGGLVQCRSDPAVIAIRIAETTPWPAEWEFGY